MKKLILLFFAVMAAFIAKADSPLTSTHFYRAHLDDDFVKMAQQQKGVLTNMFVEQIVSQPRNFAVNLAIINAIGWDFEAANSGSDHNYNLFLNYLMRKFKCKDLKDVIKKCDANTLICLAYTKALENYFDVAEALTIAEKAVKKNPTSRIIRIVYSLIYAQEHESDGGCLCFDACFSEEYYTDTKPRDIDEVWDYMKLYYNGNCEEEEYKEGGCHD